MIQGLPLCFIWNLRRPHRSSLPYICVVWGFSYIFLWSILCWTQKLDSGLTGTQSQSSLANLIHHVNESFNHKHITKYDCTALAICHRLYAHTTITVTLVHFLSPWLIDLGFRNRIQLLNSTLLIHCHIVWNLSVTHLKTKIRRLDSLKILNILYLFIQGSLPHLD